MLRNWSGCVTILAALVPLSVLGYRLQFGLDFTDEAYYAMMAVRFLRGDLPFVDELFINQTGVLMLLPAAGAYYRTFGTEGIILFLRVLYLGFVAFVASSAYLTLAQHGKRAYAVAAACVFVSFIPTSIPAPSYNSFGSGFFALGVFTGLSFLNGGGRLKWVVASISLALAAFAYPPLFVATSFFSGLVFLRKKTERRGVALAFGLAHLTVALCFLPHFLRAAESLAQSYLYTMYSHHHGGGLAKVVKIGNFLAENIFTLRAGSAVGALLLAFALRKRRSVWSGVALAVFPTLLFFGYEDRRFTSLWFLAYFTLAAPFFYALGQRTPFHRMLFIYGWVSFVVAGLVTAFTSASSPANIVVGLWGGAVLSAFLFFHAVAFRAGSQWLPRLAYVSVVGGLLAFLFAGKAFYREGDFGRLTSRIPSGPFRGLVTTPEKKTYLDNITRDIQALENDEGKIVFYEFPAGYLLTKMRPGVNSGWIRVVSKGKNFYTNYYRQHLNPKNLVFAIHEIDHGYACPVIYSMDDPFVAFVRGSHRLILERKTHQVFAPISPIAVPSTVKLSKAR